MRSKTTNYYLFWGIIHGSDTWTQSEILGLRAEAESMGKLNHVRNS